MSGSCLFHSFRYHNPFLQPKTILLWTFFSISPVSSYDFPSIQNDYATFIQAGQSPYYHADRRLAY